MCDRTDEANSIAVVERSNKRLKLWELEAHFHCAVLGTCLNMGELRKVIRQSRITFSGKPSDYVLHSTMVAQVEEKSHAARLLNKFLDRKFSRWIKLLSSKTHSADLKQLWHETRESGDISGCFWAITTHPHAEPELLSQVYGDVHMLSHIQGASNRADLKRLASLEEEVADLQQTQSKLRNNHSEQIAQRDQVISRREEELHALRLKHSQQAFLTADQNRADDPDKQKKMLQQRVDWAEDKLVQRDMRLAGLREEMSGLKELLAEVRDEHAAMEETINLLLAERNNTRQMDDYSIDLNGKRILYVGGRATLAPHLRSLVEVHNGQFDHHDGGLEESRASLQYNLSGADMVFCPIDCISHDACLRVKRHCKQQDKQFIPLRSSGISAFADGLRRLATTVEGYKAERLSRATFQ